MTIHETLPFIAAVLFPAIMIAFTQGVRIPGWYKHIGWKKINWVAFGVSVALSLTASAILLQSMLHYITSFTIVSAIALISYMAVQSLTDVVIRKADRGTLVISTLLMTPVSLLYYIYHWSYIGWYEFAAFLVAVLLSVCLSFFNSIGSSDVRAIILLVIAGIPSIGVLGLSLIMVLYAAVGIVIIAFIVFKYRVASLAYINKVSFPAVPFILFPFIPLAFYAILDVTYGLNWVVF